MKQDIEYLYFISEIEEDYITTSFERISDTHLLIFNFGEINLENIKYLAIDYSYDAFVSFYKFKYSNSNCISFYSIEKILNIDKDRMVLEIEIQKCDPVDLLIYKRDSKIDIIVD